MPDKKELGTVIVTGASRGIGAAVARLAGEAGYAVAVNFATGEADAGKVVDAIIAAGGRAVAIQANVAREAEIVCLFERAERELGPIKGLVNNAGVTGGFARVAKLVFDSASPASSVPPTWLRSFASTFISRNTRRNQNQ